MYEGQSKIYAKVLADGKFHVADQQGNDGVVKRIVEKDDGTEKVYWEKLYKALEGTISDIEIVDGDYGTTIQITLDSELTITMGTSNNFGSSFMSILPNINLKESVKIAPYSFESEGKKIKGITVYQDDKKVENYFKKSVKGKKPTLLHSFPKVDEKNKPDASASKKWSRFWRDYFEEVEEFLIESTNKFVFTTEIEQKTPTVEKEIDEDDALDSVAF